MLVERLAAFVRGSRRPFRELVDPALELLGGVVPEWPLLSAWNRWCLASGARFFVWQPERGDLPDRTRLEALLHTTMMISTKEQAVHDYLASKVSEAEVAMAGDDCVVCDDHRHRIVPLADGPMAELPPFHPGCRCGVLPRVDSGGHGNPGRGDPRELSTAHGTENRATIRHSPRTAPTTFANRTEAGRQLAEALGAVVSPPGVVAAIPRGGVAVALPIVERLGFPLTVVYARKLTTPVAPELAFGALDEDGQTIVDEDTIAGLELSAADVERAKTRVAREIERRMSLYRMPPLSQFLPGVGVILVDDGLATGLTMRAAVAYARRHGAREVTVAVPCASSSAARRFEREADRLVSLVTDEAFMAVGWYYEDFAPVSDAEVVAMLERAPRRPIRVSS